MDKQFNKEAERLIDKMIDESGLQDPQPPSEIGMDDVIKSIPAETEGVICITVNEAKEMMKRWEQLTSAPLVKRVQELEKALAIIRDAFYTEGESDKFIISDLKQVAAESLINQQP